MFVNLKKAQNIIDALIFLLLMIFAGCLSVSYGMERVWDTRNYHIYNPWALLNGRIGYDVMPAGIQSYFNPFLDIPYYLAIKYFNNFPTIITFLMGFSYALFLFIIYKIAFLVFRNYYPKILSVICVFLASGNTMNLRGIGWLSHDMFLGDLVLLSLYLILKSMEKYSLRDLFWSGFVLGLCVGLKYTTVIFSVPIGIVLLLFCKKYTKPLKSMEVFILGGFIGFIISGGIWMYVLYNVFGNPFFPYFNWLFLSDYINVENIYMADFGSQIIRIVKKDYWGLILKWNFDKRFEIMFVVFLINFALWPFVNKVKFEEYFKINENYVDFALLVCFFSYILWIKIFATPRYYAPMLGLTGIVAILVLFKALYVLKTVFSFLCKPKEKGKKILKIGGYILFFCCICYLTFLLWPNYVLKQEKKLIRVSIGEKLLDIEDLKIPDNSVVLLSEGCGIIVPFQNSKARYIKINPVWFSRDGINLYSAEKIEKIKAEIKAKADNIYFISDIDLSGADKVNVGDIEKEIHSYKEVGKISVLQSYLYELFKLGVDGKNRKCHKMKTNLVNEKQNFEASYWFCKVELLQTNSDSGGEGAITNEKN